MTRYRYECRHGSTPRVRSNDVRSHRHPWHAEGRNRRWLAVAQVLALASLALPWYADLVHLVTPYATLRNMVVVGFVGACLGPLAMLFWGVGIRRAA